MRVHIADPLTLFGTEAYYCMYNVLAPGLLSTLLFWLLLKMHEDSSFKCLDNRIDLAIYRVCLVMTEIVLENIFHASLFGW